MASPIDLHPPQGALSAIALSGVAILGLKDANFSLNQDVNNVAVKEESGFDYSVAFQVGDCTVVDSNYYYARSSGGTLVGLHSQTGAWPDAETLEKEGDPDK